MCQGEPLRRFSLQERWVMMDLDVKIPSKTIMETLRHQIAELEALEATGVATPDTCEMLVDLYNLMDRLDAMLLEHPRELIQ